MRIFNIALIGYGGFGKFLHTHWKGLKNVRITAIADPAIHKLQGLSEIKTFADWRDLLAENDLDVIAIATTPDTHTEIALACMKAGKNILLEKPLSITVEDAVRIIEVRDQTGMVAGIDFIMRFNPLLQNIQSLTAAGVFGKLRRVDVENYAQDEGLPQEHWFWDVKKSGGILIEHAVHFIDLVHFLAPSKLVRVNGLKHDRNPLQEDQIMANVVYESGLMATHYHAFSRPGFFEITKIKLAYDLADIELLGWIPLEGSVKVLVNSATKKTLLESPFFEHQTSTPVDQASDESRPEGWGASDFTAETNRKTLYSGGVPYEVEEIVRGRIGLEHSKQEVYAACVRESLLDILKKIADPDHPLTASLETGLASLKVATLATDDARDVV